MKYVINLFLVLSFGCIAWGYFFAEEYSEKFIGSGVCLLFFVVFPLFSYHKWKDKDIKDYMLTKENIEEMRKDGKL